MNWEDLARNETQATSPRLLMLISLACLHFYLFATGSFELIIYSHWYGEIKLEPGWGWPAVKRCFSWMIHGWHSGSESDREKAAVYVLEVKLRVGRKLFALVRRGGSSKLDLCRISYLTEINSCWFGGHLAEASTKTHTSQFCYFEDFLASETAIFKGSRPRKVLFLSRCGQHAHHSCVPHFVALRRSLFIHLCFGKQFIWLASGNNRQCLLSTLTPFAIPAVGSGFLQCRVCDPPFNPNLQLSQRWRFLKNSTTLIRFRGSCHCMTEMLNRGSVVKRRIKMGHQSPGVWKPTAHKHAN